ncbi:hypothetical protein [Azospirillum endophyticum]
MPFQTPVTILHGENGVGKSAVTKSLYDVFGATPHQIDGSWRGAGVSTLLQFSVDDQIYLIAKHGNHYAIFDRDDNLVIRADRPDRDLKEFLCELLDFRLVMVNREDEAIIPPISYMFSPFYVDQDRGWSDAWSSFDGMNIPGTKTTLSEYHSGTKPNKYYVALAGRNLAKREKNFVLKERALTDRAFSKIKSEYNDKVLYYRIEDFSEEVGQIVAESTALRDEQSHYRSHIIQLKNEKIEWQNQVSMLRKAASEIGASFRLAHSKPEDIHCPTCGAIYHNSLIERFGLIANEDNFLQGILDATERMGKIDNEIRSYEEKLSSISSRLHKISSILEIRRNGLTFSDVISARSRMETVDVFMRQLSDLDDAANRIQMEIDEREREMQMSSSVNRTRLIKYEFQNNLRAFSRLLDVRASHVENTRLTGTVKGRGSERPRALLAYYYSFLHIAREYSSSSFCPIVFDAPNQQGQDETHLPSVMKFLIDERPSGSQLIIAAEKLYGVRSGENISVVNIENRRNRVLREEQYEDVSRYVRPYLGTLI